MARFDDVFWMLRPGATNERSLAVLTFFSFSSSPLTAIIEIGTSRMFSPVRRAVTMISLGPFSVVWPDASTVVWANRVVLLNAVHAKAKARVFIIPPSY